MNNASLCPCGSKINYALCCQPFHQYERDPETAEALMRSRYSAYTKANIAYIKHTMRGKPLNDFNEHDAIIWAKSVKWLGLKIKNTKQASKALSYVEFIARFIEGGQHRTLHEISEFHFTDGKWFYVDGELL